MNEERFNKLPKWAQDEFKNLQRERNIAVRALNQYVDEQTPSTFYIEELESIGGKKGPTLMRRYIQTYKISVNYAGVNLDVVAKDDCIDLSWCSSESRTSREVALIPQYFQSARLVSKENMR